MILLEIQTACTFLTHSLNSTVSRATHILIKAYFVQFTNGATDIQRNLSLAKTNIRENRYLLACTCC